MPKPRTRRDGREAALQFLFSHDLNGLRDAAGGEEVEAFWALRPARSSVREFATELINGILGHLDELDLQITEAAENYTLRRIAAVDRNLLRLSAFELLYCEDIPAPVAINEAIEIAKRFGTEDSARFVNGVLDRILRGVKKEVIGDQS